MNGMNNDTICLLKECNSGCKNATNSMEQVLPFCKEDSNLKKIIDDNLNDYLDYLKLERRYSINTIESYKHELISFRDYIKKDYLKVSTKI